jgi:hypothetical protein
MQEGIARPAGKGFVRRGIRVIMHSQRWHYMQHRTMGGYTRLYTGSCVGALTNDR